MTAVMQPQDAQFMARAIRLAASATLDARPNPRVGCVIVAADGSIVAEGQTQAYGQAHAEAVALAAAGAAAAGATAYVSLEPCNHQGKTGPCAQALIAAGVARVVCALADDNPAAKGGLAALQAAGIDTAVGLMGGSALEINPGFHRRARGGLPWVRMKMAGSQDGVTALSNGRSQWITGASARRDGQYWRARSCAIVTGSGTVLADNPRLTVREWPCERQPLRVVVDRRGRVPSDSGLFQSPNPALHLTGANWPPATVLGQLADQGCNEILLEAGPTLSAAWLQAGVVDELILYQNPSVLGPGRSLFDLAPLSALERRWRLQVNDRRQFGEDSRIIARPVREDDGGGAI